MEKASNRGTGILDANWQGVYVLYATMHRLHSPWKERSTIFVGLELVACHVDTSIRSYNMKMLYDDSEYMRQILNYPSNPGLKKWV